MHQLPLYMDLAICYKNEVFAGSCMTRIYGLCERPLICPRQQNMLGLTCNRPHASGVKDSRPLCLTLRSPILGIVV